MSFLKIKDPSKRDALVAEYLKTKNKIQNDFLSERLGKQSLYEDFEKIFKPITELQKKSSEEIVSMFTPLKETIENIPTSLPWKPELPEIEFPMPINVGPIAHEYLSNYLTEKGDRTFGIKYENGVYYLRNTNVDFDGNNLIIGFKEYEGRNKGLWGLLTSVKPSLKDTTDNDFQNYSELMIATNAMSHSEKINRPAANKGDKWKEIIKPIWDSVEAKQKRKPKQKANLEREGKKELKKVMKDVRKMRTKSEPGTSGQGLLPSDPNALCERLELLMASKQAGNTGLRNEIVSICDELLRQKVLSLYAYKNLMLTLNKDVNY